MPRIPSDRKIGLTLLWGAPFLLAACSGGSDGDASPAPAPVPANRAPAFTSPATASVDENTTGSIYTFAVSDPDGDSLSVSVVPGGDEAAFDIDPASRTIRPAASLDFETPADADGDNVYDVTLEARDPGGLTARLNLAITVNDVVEGMMAARVGTGFTQPLYLAGLPGTTQVVVLEKGGRIRVLDPETGTIDPVDFLDVSGETSAAGEGGLLGLAFSPDFATDRTFYINLTNNAGDTEIRRYQMFSGSLTQADPATADIILTVDQPASNHNAGWIGFAADGMLFVPTGDGGGAGDPDGYAQNVNSLLGKILRIDVRGDDFPTDDARDYAIPAGNAFTGAAGLPEIFALGLRNPFRCSFDDVTGDLFIGDVGQGAVEEVDRLRMSDAGTNFGWNIQEGTQDYSGADRADLVDPVAAYGHGAGLSQGQSLTGGYVYRGNLELIKDHYVFADFVSGNVWAVPVDDLVIGQTVFGSAFLRINGSLMADAGTVESISSFGEDNERNLYIVSILGDVFRIQAAQP
ncbi:MAG: PQQ-dependent sugar dehydrogenase [Alphaproteobacteria bacterium]|uniref:PQQ-dependent sugar dehydrogenase n=1 Tax=Hyphomonas sp. TaxID=87 RepID=UPI001DF2603B|nr:PQQ-dependent sugar dehydrogenase [Alphaproteobacteria bacterium]MBU2082445.1 PQQ-dependent sugar dehydrogenase [Alphaproteobacteria bacterium]MBU2141456.1 PQQ-dependent sugar dehydrogenase [Alphaproteobacteria bacterium]